MASAVLAIAYIAIRPSPSRGALPSDPRALAARVAAHPADWLAASALAEGALDAPARDPRALWRASGALAISLAPSLPEPRSSFARAGFFHWNELSAVERNAVLDAYAPLLRDRTTFFNMYAAIYALTGDFDYVRRNRPPGDEATAWLADLAVTNGRFDDYRALRGRGSTSREIESREVDAAKSVAITVATLETDNVPPYVLIYIDGILRDEGAVIGQQVFTVPAAGTHLLEIRLANPATRNGGWRRVQVVRVQAL